MKLRNNYFKEFLLFVTLGACLQISNAQSLYTESGRNTIPPVSNRCDPSIIQVSKIDVNNDLVEQGLYNYLPIESNFKVHTQCAGHTVRKDFDQITRWYQEDGKTQIFRIFKDEDEPSGRGRGRTECHGQRWEYGDGWQEWVGRYTFIKPINCSLLQVKSNAKKYEWPLQITYGEGHVQVHFRKPTYSGSDLTGGTTQPNIKLAKVGAGESVDIRVRDNGKKTIIYINNEEKASFDFERPRGSNNHFRWGMYVGNKRVSHDAMIFISHANQNPVLRDNNNNDNDPITPEANQAPSVSFGNATPANLNVKEGYKLSLNVLASDSDGTVKSVDLYIDDKKIRTETSAPYDWGHESSPNPTELNGLEAGTYTIKAIATDNDNASSETFITLNVEEEGVYTFNTIDDAYIQSGRGYNDNDLKVEAGNRIVYMKFDISNLPKTKLESAKLNLTVGNDAGSGVINIYEGHTTNNWAEESITPNNAPTKGKKLVSMNALFSTNKAYDFNLSEVNIQDNEINLIIEMEQGGNDVWFASKENEAFNAPRLSLKVLDQASFDNDPTLSIFNLNSDYNSKSKFQVYPNPVSDILNFSEKTSWKLYNLQGQKVDTGYGNNLDMSKKAKGLYLLENGNSFTKVLKQ